MTFPVTLRHRSGKVKIYAPAKSFAYYRLSFTVAGKRQMQTFGTYTEAKAAAEAKAKEIHDNAISAGLSARQSRDALAALERLEAHFRATGRRIGLNAAVGGLDPGECEFATVFLPRAMPSPWQFSFYYATFGSKGTAWNAAVTSDWIR